MRCKQGRRSLACTLGLLIAALLWHELDVLIVDAPATQKLESVLIKPDMRQGFLQAPSAQVQILQMGQAPLTSLF